MKNNVLMLPILLIAFLAAYTVLVFQLQLDHTPAFWAEYGFTLIAFLLQIFAVVVAFSQPTKKDTFLGLPVAMAAGIYLFAQLAWGLVVMNIPAITLATATLVSFLMLAFMFVSIFMASQARQTINQLDESLTQSQSFIKNSRVLLNGISLAAGSEEAERRLAALRDLAQFSDPRSIDSTQAIEAEISEMIEQFAALNQNGEAEKLEMMIDQINEKLTQRNLLLKANK